MSNKQYERDIILLDWLISLIDSPLLNMSKQTYEHN